MSLFSHPSLTMKCVIGANETTEFMAGNKVGPSKYASDAYKALVRDLHERQG
jgi:hypothetical protein